jgi:phosphoglycerol transferase MdoB-like AlkP superfamily enzyme
MPEFRLPGRRDAAGTPPPARPPVPPTTRRRLLILALTGAITLVWAGLANLGLDLSMWTVKPFKLWYGPFHTGGWVPNVVIVWLVITLVLAITGRLWITLGIAGILTLSLGFINIAKLTLRNDPLRLSDESFLSQPGFLVEMVGVRNIVLGVLGIAVVLAAAWFIGRLVHRRLPHVGTGLSRRGLWLLRGARFVVAVVCIALLAYAGNFNDPGNKWRAAYDSTGLRWRSWDQRANFLRNGFVAGLLYNTHIQAMDTPDGYSKAAMAEIAQRYTAEAATMNRGRTGSLDDTNIVSILSESFTDPSWLKSVRWSEELAPATKAEMARTVSGKMLSPGYGGGTANIEFELLTGQSLSQFNPQLDSLYEQVVSKYPSYPSAIEYLRKRGHYPVAMHPFSFRMYQRPRVFDAFGFQKLIDKDHLEKRYRVDGGRYISDKAAFENVELQVEEQSKPLFMHLISMQNHMPYEDQYDDPIMPKSGLPPNKAALAGQYARGIRNTDEALAGFLRDLKKSAEPTVVIFYGDHQPAQIYPANFTAREGTRVAHETPFMIWSNTTPLEHTELPTTSPIQFLPKLFDATNTPIPPYYALLDRLDQQLPAMDVGLYIDGNDRVVKEQDFTPEQQQVLRDYRLVQYDLSIGNRYSEKALFGDPPA